MAKIVPEAPPGGWELAQVDVGSLLAPRGSARVEPFFAALDRVNALADASPEFD